MLVDTTINVEASYTPSDIPGKIDRLHLLKARNETKEEDIQIEKAVKNFYVDWNYSYIKNDSYNRSTNIMYSKGLLDLLREETNSYADGSYVLRADGVADDTKQYYEILEAPAGMIFEIKNLTTGYGTNEPTCPFEVLVSNDGINYTTLYRETSSLTYKKIHTMSGEARFVKLNITNAIDGVKQIFFSEIDQSGTTPVNNGNLDFWDIKLKVPDADNNFNYAKLTNEFFKIYNGSGEVTYEPDGSNNTKIDPITDIHTSNISSSGEIFTNANDVNFPAFNAFDQDLNTYMSGNGANYWVAYKFNNPKQINKLILMSHSTTKSELAKEWKILASNDSTDGSDGTWDELGNNESGHTPDAGVAYTSVINYFINANSYRWYKIQLVANWGGATTHLKEIKWIEAVVSPIETNSFSIMDIVLGSNQNDDGTYITHVTAPEDTDFEEIWDAGEGTIFQIDSLTTEYYQNGSNIKFTCPFEIFGSTNGIEWTSLYESKDYLSYRKVHSVGLRTRFLKFKVTTDKRSGADKARMFFVETDNFNSSVTKTQEDIIRIDLHNINGLRLETSDNIHNNLPNGSNSIGMLISGNTNGSNLFDTNSLINQDAGLEWEETYDAGFGWKYDISEIITSGVNTTDGYKGATPFEIFASDDAENWSSVYQTSKTTGLTIHNIDIKARFLKFKTKTLNLEDGYKDRITLGANLDLDGSYSLTSGTEHVAKTNIVKRPYIKENVSGDDKSVDESIHVLNGKLTSSTVVPTNQNGLCISLDTRGHKLVISEGSVLVAL